MMLHSSQTKIAFVFSQPEAHNFFMYIFYNFFRHTTVQLRCLTRQSLLNGLQLKIFEYLTNSEHVTDWYSGKYNLHSQTIYTKIIKIFDQIYKLILAWLLGELLSSFFTFVAISH